MGSSVYDARGMNSLLRRALPLICVGIVACSSGEDLPDATVEIDMGVAVDAGVRTLCPIPENNPTCQMAEDCDDELAPPANCQWCRTRNNSVCAVGQCASPDLIDGNQFLLFSFRAPDLETVLQSYAGYAVAKETAGGSYLTCDQMLAGNVDWDEPCLNIIDARYADNSSQQGDTFPMNFSRIPGGLDVLLVVYAFDTEFAASQPIGVACAEASVPLKGETEMPTEVSGGEMTDLR